jgi:hypothetical protein
MVRYLKDSKFFALLLVFLLVSATDTFAQRNIKIVAGFRGGSNIDLAKGGPAFGGNVGGLIGVFIGDRLLIAQEAVASMRTYKNEPNYTTTYVENYTTVSYLLGSWASPTRFRIYAAPTVNVFLDSPYKPSTMKKTEIGFATGAGMIRDLDSDGRVKLIVDLRILQGFTSIVGAPEPVDGQPAPEASKITNKTLSANIGLVFSIDPKPRGRMRPRNKY